ncbi:3 beta-hydroxysteroid dehydrogenase/Delta 5--_4-isomerase type 1-like isoform X2 [Liolophura sinensis]|uniref:3 beta-hydroxysteroid dehydrogenase/Delta 5-->4-isomerase type 1-like isoform X2 n=1 Tax=Liolophura sinensis TaxID=3198878 RepID=UPI0031590C4A
MGAVRDGLLGRKREVVLVIGGCGFLGRHLVRLLAEKCDNVAEIRTLDIQDPPEELQQRNFKVKVTHVKGDLRKRACLDLVCEGVTAVFHTASIVDISTLQDTEYITSVNVEGTQTILDACVSHNVPMLIYTSSSELARGSKPVLNHREEDAENFEDKDLILGDYSNTKRAAEKLVLSYDGRKLSNGSTLRTISFRPCGIYGEGDHTFVTAALQAAKMCGGILCGMGSHDVIMQKVYVGNTAWIQLCGWKRARQDPTVCGQAYLATDDTAIDNNFAFFKVFVESRNWKVLPFYIPFFAIYYTVLLMELFVWLLSPIVRLPLPVSTREVLMACTTCYYDGSKARKLLNYSPLYDAKESIERSKKYYSTVKL